MEKLETRQFANDVKLETRANGESTKNLLVGYAARFDVLGEDWGGYREKILPGAFIKALEENDIRAFWGHDTDWLPLGRKSAGTLKLEEDDKGLRFELDLPDWATDLAESVQRGDVDGMSFGFTRYVDDWNEGGTIRTFSELNLIEISPVNFPAWRQTEVDVSREMALRSREEWLKEQPQPEPSKRKKLLADILNATAI